jgi:hypothetical protein
MNPIKDEEMEITAFSRWIGCGTVRHYNGSGRKDGILPKTRLVEGPLGEPELSWIYRSRAQCPIAAVGCKTLRAMVI